MAFLVKSQRQRTGGPSNPGTAVLNQWIQVSRPAANLPQTESDQLFRVKGGRVLIHLLVGEVTTVIDGTDPQASVHASRLSDASVLVGTADEVASTLDIKTDEVGTIYVIEGDTSAIASTGVAAQQVAPTAPWIMPQGQIYLTTAASETGAIKWDLWYQPLDAGAYVEAVADGVAAIT